MKFQMFTEETCFPQIRSDFCAAEHIIVNQTPYLTAAGIKREQAAILEAISRGVIYIAAFQPPNNWTRRDDPSLSADEKLNMQKTKDGVTWLLAHGAIPVAVDKGHQKFIIVDRKIVWDGTMNLLSWYDTHEHWNRTESRAKVLEIERMHHLDPLYLLDLSREQGLFPDAPELNACSARKVIGTTIVALRKKHKLTQEELAKRAGISRPSLRVIEGGSRDYGLDLLLRVTGVFQKVYALAMLQTTDLHSIASQQQYFQVLGRQIARRRQSLGLSQRDLAKLLGVSQSYIGKIEGACISQRHDMIHKLCLALFIKFGIYSRQRASVKSD